MASEPVAGGSGAGHGLLPLKASVAGRKQYTVVIGECSRPCARSQASLSRQGGQNRPVLSLLTKHHL